LILAAKRNTLQYQTTIGDGSHEKGRIGFVKLLCPTIKELSTSREVVVAMNGKSEASLHRRNNK
jgi:hypothetical protein